MLIYIISTILFLHIPPISAEVNLDPSFLKTLDDPTITTVGILHSAYSNSKLPETAWARCEYCTKCPKFEEPLTQNLTSTTTNFRPCPEQLNILSDRVKHEHDYIRDIWDRYTSEFLGFSSDRVLIVRRVMSRNGPNTPLPANEEEFHVLIPEMNVSLTKFKLNRVDFDATLRPPKDMKDNSKGEDWAWNKLSLKDPLRGPRVKFGDASFKDRGWKGQGTETTTLWPMKDGLTRTDVVTSLIKLVELRETGCACIRSHLGPSFSGTVQELQQICRNTLNVTSEDVRSAIKLSTCLTPTEEKEMRATKPAEEGIRVHKEL